MRKIVNTFQQENSMKDKDIVRQQDLNSFSSFWSFSCYFLSILFISGIRHQDDIEEVSHIYKKSVNNSFMGKDFYVLDPSGIFRISNASRKYMSNKYINFSLKGGFKDVYSSYENIIIRLDNLKNSRYPKHFVVANSKMFTECKGKIISGKDINRINASLDDYIVYDPYRRDHDIKYSETYSVSGIRLCV